ncbi:2'-5' RNA ligase family protein [Sphingomonas sp.]|uniref:2'-5' RNA ligase family protein n=1 Tax=Sphingomonas sp. TaxID=28214 RepID=UPI0035C87CE6
MSGGGEQGASLNAPIIVTTIFAPSDQAWFDAQRREYFPPERNQLDAHLTMFHHLPPSVAAEVKRRLSEETRGVAAPAARVGGLINLGRGVAYRIESPDLVSLRARLADAFTGLLTPQDQAGWRPHVTIQNKVEPGEAKKTLAALQAGFSPRTVRVAGLAAWWYRGGPWEQLSVHKFSA